MERLTYVTEDGTVLFSPDGKDAVTITDISAMGDTEYLEQIADTLANREVAAMFYERKYNEVCNELKEYEDTGLAPEQVRELAEEQQSRREWYQKGYADGKKDAENDRWIPVEERLPGFNACNPITRDPCVYPVTIDLGGITDIRYYSFWKGHWYKQGPKIMDDLVIAWQPLQEPYKPEEEGTKCAAECTYNRGNECPAASGCAGHEEDKEYCCNCRWYDIDAGVCCNASSDYCADFRSMDDSCEEWEER